MFRTECCRARFEREPFSASVRHTPVPMAIACLGLNAGGSGTNHSDFTRTWFRVQGSGFSTHG